MDKEKQWIKQIKSKSDRSAANTLISKYYEEVYGYVYKQTTNKELSMDLTQEIFISVLQSIHNYDEKKASFRTWLYKVSTYRIVDYYRSKYYKYNSRVVPIIESEVYDSQDFTITIEYKEDVEKIMGIVHKLDTQVQQIFRLKFFSEYTFLEISKMLYIPESTVKSKYYSMIRKIKKGFGGE